MLEKKVLIKDLKPGQDLEDIFVVKFRKPIKPYASGFSFVLRLSDSSGDTMLKYWGSKDEEKVKQVFDSIHEDDIILVKGRTAEYKKTVEIHVNEGQGSVRACSEGEFDPQIFIRVSEKDAEEMYSKLLKYVDAVENQEYKKVLEAFFKDEEFSKAFKRSPAAMYKHHGWLGGLLEHTLTVTNIAMDLFKHHPKLDKDLLIAGALLHDIGKIKEFEVKSSIKVSIEGQLIGHIIIGTQMLNEKLKELKTSKDCCLKLNHILISHHGNLEYGSPKKPAFPEALVIYYADELDSKTIAIIEAKETAQTEDAFIHTSDFGNVYLK